MSQYDDDNSFDGSEETDPISRELRVEIIRLEAELDQLQASLREQAAEAAIIRIHLAELEVRVARLEARHRRDTRILLFLWVMMTISLVISLYTYFTT